MQLYVSKEVAALCERAVAISVRNSRFFVGVEHLFAAVLEHPESLPPSIQNQFLDQLMTTLREVERRAGPVAAIHAGAEIFHTPRAIAATQAATRLAERAGQGGAGAPHLLLAILQDGRSLPSRCMDSLAFERAALIERLLRAVSGPSGHRHQPTPSQPDVTPAAQAEGSPPSGLSSAFRDLDQEARRGKLQDAIGRKEELFEILQVLTRKGKNNVILVGEAGVGKTQLVEGLAYRMARNDMPDSIPRFHIVELNLAALLSGTQYRGVLEEKLLALLEQLKDRPDAVLFIDEIHLIMGAGATQGDGMDLGNLLKPVLSRGDIRCVGATTVQEYRKFVERDPAIERRFQMVRLNPLSEEATLEVLRRLRPGLEKHHGVSISTRAMEAAVQLTERYMPNRNLPDKAIDVLDQACARYRLKAVAFDSDPATFSGMPLSGEPGRVLPHDIRKVVSQATAIPLEELSAQERLHLNHLERRLKEILIGQDEAVHRAVAAVKKSRAGLSDPNRPDAILLFAGPTGVGKTQLAKLLAEHVFGSSSHLFTFDMSEFVEEHSVSRLLGAPPGYAGHEEEGRLSAAVRHHPYSILLFDEIEKAHPRVFDILLPVFEEGRIKDNRGRDVNFRHCIIIMTSNVGASLLMQRQETQETGAIIAQLRQHFRPEFINRIDEVVPFYPLLAEDIRNILRLEINRLRLRLRDRNIGVRMFQRAYEFLAEKGYNSEFGARELRRVVDKYVAEPISALLLDDCLESGDVIEVLMEDDGLRVRRGPKVRQSSLERLP